jgi:hypothetical protein
MRRPAPLKPSKISVVALVVTFPGSRYDFARTIGRKSKLFTHWKIDNVFHFMPLEFLG